ncbi:hypothetical protein [Mycolicibacterium setense]|uniref:hypothetical protein n=1 Tax=Mycolicibacterium setense TaxID=431269 RepID=UPI0005736C93|nr:hypothetical protein [Mycolicibacterium setense]KHO24274.1 hypothetical protein QQ25_06220 [Mycolicibacterium setense]MCV7109602.1 hypothetical protein [Mycolicibacterium setense]
MSEMLQIIALMAVPVAILLGLRSVVACQNRRLDSQASTPYRADAVEFSGSVTPLGNARPV